MSERFRVDIDSQGLSLHNPGGVFKFQPGDIDLITELLGFAARVADWKVVPKDGLDSGPFRVWFGEDGDMSLQRVDGENGGVSFTIQEIDTVIEFFKQGVGKAVDFVTLRGGPRRGVAPTMPDIIIEGR